MGDNSGMYEPASPILKKVLLILVILLIFAMVAGIISYNLGNKFDGGVSEDRKMEKEKYRILNLTEDGLYVDGGNVVDCSDLSFEECQGYIENLNSGGGGSSGAGGESDNGNQENADQGFDDFGNTGSDSDSDGVPDESDNCPFDYNPFQEDSDGDGLGDICDNEMNLIDYNNSILFDGTNYVRKELPQNLRSYGGFPKTLSAWAKVEPNSVSTQKTVAWIGRRDTGQHYLSIGFYNNGDGTISPLMRTRASGSETDVGSIAVQENVFNHIVGVWESPVSRKLYFNGELVGSFTDAIGPFDDGGNSKKNGIAAGRSDDSTPEGQFLGELADVQFWNYGMSEDDVIYAYNNPDDYFFDRDGSQDKIAEAIAIWEMTEQEGSKIHDTTNLDNHGANLRGGAPAEIISFEEQYNFSGRMNLPDFGPIEEYYEVITGDEGQDWKKAFERAQIALRTVILDGDYFIKGRINVQPNRTFTSTNHQGVIRFDHNGLPQGPANGSPQRLFVFNGQQDNSWYGENITFTKLTMDFHGTSQYGSIFWLAGDKGARNLYWHNLTFIDSTNSPHTQDTQPGHGGDMWGIDPGGQGGAANINLHVTNNRHLAPEHQLLSGGVHAGGTVDGMYVNNNFASGGRSIVLALLGHKLGGQTMRNIEFKNNVILEAWRHGITIGIDSGNDQTGQDDRFLDIRNVIVEDNYIEFNDPELGNTQSAPGILLKFGDSPDSVTEDIIVRNNVVIDNTNGARQVVVGFNDGDYYDEPPVGVIFDSNQFPWLRLGGTNLSTIEFVNNQIGQWSPRPDAYIFNGNEVGVLNTPVEVTDNNLDIEFHFQSLDNATNTEYLVWGGPDEYVYIDHTEGRLRARFNGCDRPLTTDDKVGVYRVTKIRILQVSNTRVNVSLNDRFHRDANFGCGQGGIDFTITSFGGNPTSTENSFNGRLNDIIVQDGSGERIKYVGVGSVWEDEVENNNVIIRDIG